MIWNVHTSWMRFLECTCFCVFYVVSLGLCWFKGFAFGFDFARWVCCMLILLFKLMWYGFDLREVMLFVVCSVCIVCLLGLLA